MEKVSDMNWTITHHGRPGMTGEGTMAQLLEDVAITLALSRKTRVYMTIRINPTQRRERSELSLTINAEREKASQTIMAALRAWSA